MTAISTLYVANQGASRLFRNDGTGAFTDVAPPVLTTPAFGSGMAWGDYDNDGDLDIYQSIWGANKLFRNELALGNHWLHVDLVGTISNRSGIGMRVRVAASGMSQIREVSGGSGLYSQNSLTVEFGLGAATTVDTVEVLWTSGIIDRLPGVATDQRITITETPPWGLITSVADVPDDQGGWVRVHFQRSGFDRAEVAPYPITTYHIYRRVDTPAPVAEARSERGAHRHRRVRGSWWPAWPRATTTTMLPWFPRWWIRPAPAPDTPPGTFRPTRGCAESDTTAPPTAAIPWTTSPRVCPRAWRWRTTRAAATSYPGTRRQSRTSSTTIYIEGAIPTSTPTPGNLVHASASTGWTDPDYRRRDR